MNFEILENASFAIQVHVAVAYVATLLGPLALIRRKRDRLHKIVGYVWVIAMALTALSSFFIFEIRLVGWFSPIHLLSLYALWSLVAAIRSIRQKNVSAHRRHMWGIYSQAIGIAGLFTFLPERMMNDLFMAEAPWVVFLGAVLLYGVVLFAVRRAMPRLA